MKRLLLALLLFTCARPALADVRYSVESSRVERQSEDDSYAPMRISHTNRTYLMTAGKERVEETLQFNSYPFHLNTIYLANSKQMVHLAPDLKICTIEPLDPRELNHLLPLPRRRYSSGGSGTSGSSVTTYTIEDKAMETVQAQKAHHYVVTAATVESGCLGSHQVTEQTEVWVVPMDLGFPVSPSTWTVQDQRGCTITYEERGDLALLQTIRRGVIVREKMTPRGPVGGSQELVSYFTSPVDYSLFIVPADYKKLERAAFKHAVEEALIQSVLRHAP